MSFNLYAVRGLCATLLLVLVFQPLAKAADDPILSSGWRFQQRSGPGIYAALCAACHMPDGQGARGAAAYPALLGNAKLASSGLVMLYVLRGHKAMPGFAAQLDNDQVAEVVNHVRQTFGGVAGDSATATMVQALRP